jgi:hypothetical protein
MRKWLFEKIFKKELAEKEEIISVLIKDLEEEIELIDLYEQEIVRIENELKITNLILESLNLYGNRGK